MLQQDKPDDYILATGETHTIKEFIGWVEEITGKPMKVIIDNRFVRPQDVSLLCGNPTKAFQKLGWKAIIKGKELVRKMLK
jgi:GDPmannose 4,6-dehydratase